MHQLTYTELQVNELWAGRCTVRTASRSSPATR